MGISQSSTHCNPCCKARCVLLDWFLLSARDQSRESQTRLVSLTLKPLGTRCGKIYSKESEGTILTGSLNILEHLFTLWLYDLRIPKRPFSNIQHSCQWIAVTTCIFSSAKAPSLRVKCQRTKGQDPTFGQNEKKQGWQPKARRFGGYDLHTSKWYRQVTGWLVKYRPLVGQVWNSTNLAHFWQL